MCTRGGVEPGGCVCSREGRQEWNLGGAPLPRPGRQTDFWKVTKNTMKQVVVSLLLRVVVGAGDGVMGPEANDGNEEKDGW